MGWESLPDEQPIIDVHLAFHNGGRKEIVESGESCRDAIVADVTHHMRVAFDHSPSGVLSLSHPSCRAVGANFMECETFTRKRDIEDMIFLADAIAGLPGIIISEDRYVGNWCLTTREEVLQYRKASRGYYLDEERASTFRWYGIDNSPLASPAFLYLITGLFRQAVRVHEEELEEGIEDVVSREEVSKAMETSDKDLAWHLLQKIKPWIVGGNKRASLYLPLGGERWSVLEEIYKFTKNNSLSSLLGGDLVASWQLNSLYCTTSANWQVFSRAGNPWRRQMRRAIKHG